MAPYLIHKAENTFIQRNLKMTNKEQINKIKDNAELAWAAYSPAKLLSRYRKRFIFSALFSLLALFPLS